MTHLTPSTSVKKVTEPLRSFPSSCLWGACICSHGYLDRAPKTCDDIDSTCILAQLGCPVRLLFPIFHALLVLRSWVSVRILHGRYYHPPLCQYLFLVMISRNPLDYSLTRSLRLVLSSSGSYNNNHILHR